MPNCFGELRDHCEFSPDGRLRGRQPFGTGSGSDHQKVDGLQNAVNCTVSERGDFPALTTGRLERAGRLPRGAPEDEARVRERRDEYGLGDF